MTTAVRCVVFDLDDTLYLERDYVRSGFAAVGRYMEASLGEPYFEAAAWREFEEGQRGDIFNRALKDFGLEASSNLVGELVDAYRTHLPDIRLQADAVSCLIALGGNTKLGLISDGPLASQKAKVEVLDLGRQVDQIILTAELGPEFGKPHPRAFEEMQQRLDAEAAECVYVADNPAKDFAGPKSLGWSTIRIRRPLGLYSSSDSGADVDLEVTTLQPEEILAGAGHS